MAWDLRSISLRRWIGLAIFVASYVSLYFGLYGALVHYEDTAELKPSWFQNHEDHIEEEAVTELVNIMGDNAKIPIVPSTTRALLGDRGSDWSLLHVLLDKAEKGHTSYLAAYFLIFFGMVLPGFKFLAVTYWILSPFPGGGQMVTIASRLTRWTAVDAVAEAMIVALLLRGDVHAEHRKGYLCFVGYIMCSAIAIWFMDENGDTRGPSFGARILNTFCKNLRIPSCLTVLTLIAFISLAFFGATYYPLALITVPRDQIRGSVEWAIHPYKNMLDFLGEEDDVQRLIDEVLPHLPVPNGSASVAVAVKTLLWSGHVFTIAGSVMLFTGVIFCPLIEAILGVFLVFQAKTISADVPSVSTDRSGINSDEEKSSLLDQDDAAVTGDLLRHSAVGTIVEMAADLAMLDVFVVGMAVATAILGTLGDVLVAELLEGFWCLIPAVLVGWLHNALCSAIVHNTDKRKAAHNKAASEARLASARKIEQAEQERRDSKSLFSPMCCVRTAQSGKTIE